MQSVKRLGRLVLLLALAALCSSAAATSASSAAATSAQAHTGTLGHSGRFYTVDGHAAVLVGMDMQELAANPQIDYTSVLDALQANDVNAIRLWIYPAWAPSSYLEPWTYGVCAPGKYDLDAWNPAYWTRLRAVVDAAQTRNIYVELSIFPANYLDASRDWNSQVVRFAWNAAFNCNGEFAANPVGTFVPQFWNPDPGSQTYVRQKQLVDKVLATFPYSSYQNVSFEIANEFPGVNSAASPAGSNSQLTNPDLPAWQNSWIDYIKANNPGRVVSAFAQDWTGNNTNGIDNYWDKPNVDILDFHMFGESVTALLDPIGANQKNKILQDNESTGNEYGNENTTDLATQRAWTWNANLGYVKWYWDNSQLALTDPQFTAALQRLKIMSEIDNEVGWTDLSDVDPSGQQYNTLVSQNPTGDWNVLANPSTSHYLYYGWGTNLDRPLEITLGSGLYLYKWINPQDGSALSTGFVAADGESTAIAQPSGWNTTAGVVLTAVPASKDACKHGGWMKFDNPVFTNQGDCVSYVATGGRN